jgi:hypothetical protein
MNEIIIYTWEESKAVYNMLLPKVGIMDFFENFVLNKTLIFQINISA